MVFISDLQSGILCALCLFVANAMHVHCSSVVSKLQRICFTCCRDYTRHDPSELDMDDRRFDMGM